MSENKKSKKGKKIALAIICFLLAICIVVFAVGFNYWKNLQEAEPVVEDTLVYDFDDETIPEKLEDAKEFELMYEGDFSDFKTGIKEWATNGGEIITISSMSGVTPMPYFAEYSATKSALIYFYKGLKKELKGSGVKITVLCPGSVPTRQDIIKDIKSQGLTGKLSKKSPKFVVEKGLKALSKNKTICVPGFYNKVVSFISRITPYSVKASVIAKKFKDKEKDAF